MLQSSENEWIRDKGLNMDTSQKYNIEQKQKKVASDRCRMWYLYKVLKHAEQSNISFVDRYICNQSIKTH